MMLTPRFSLVRDRGTNLTSTFAASRAAAAIYRALQQGFLDDGATHAQHRSPNPPPPASYRRQNPARYRCDSQVTAKRRKEIARIVSVLPHGQRAGLIEALLAFADAAGEPDAPTTTAAVGVRDVGMCARFGRAGSPRG